MSTLTICYLCGKPLVAPINDDHVPARQFFAPSLRRTHNISKLITKKVHKACNSAYSLDEEYFVQTLVPFARGSVAGNAIFEKTIAEFHEKRRQGRPHLLVQKVLGEFEARPSGLFLPAGRIAKRFDGNRMKRVAWKIVRGLLFHHHGEIYPEDWTVAATLTAPGERPPDHFLEFMKHSRKAYGEYPGIFDYRFETIPIEPSPMHYWALLFWDKIICTVAFHDARCGCEECRGAPHLKSVAGP